MIKFKFPFKLPFKFPFEFPFEFPFKFPFRLPTINIKKYIPIIIRFIVLAIIIFGIITYIPKQRLSMGSKITMSIIIIILFILLDLFDVWIRTYKNIFCECEKLVLERELKFLKDTDKFDLV